MQIHRLTLCVLKKAPAPKARCNRALRQKLAAQTNLQTTQNVVFPNLEKQNLYLRLNYTRQFKLDMALESLLALNHFSIQFYLPAKKLRANLICQTLNAI